MIVAIALLPGADTTGTSFSGSIRARNTTLSCASANNRGAAIMQNKTTMHSFLMDFLRVLSRRGGEGRSLARHEANCTNFDIPLLAEEGWREARARAKRKRDSAQPQEEGEASINGQTGETLRRTDHPDRSFQSRPPLLCEEGNRLTLARAPI